MTNQEYTSALNAIRTYKTARVNVLVVLLLTALNTVCALAMDSNDGSYYYILTSLYSVVQLVAAMRTIQLFPFVASGMEEMIISFVVIGLAVLFTAAVIVFGLLSKKRRWAMIVLLVLFSVDAAWLLIDFMLMMQVGVLILDIAAHAYCIVFFALAIRAASQLSRRFPESVTLTVARLNQIYRDENGIDPVTGRPINYPGTAFGGAGAPGNNASGYGTYGQYGSGTGTHGTYGQGTYGQGTYGQGTYGTPGTYGAPFVPPTAVCGSGQDGRKPIGYDPMTGKPIYPADRPARFDPMTGKPLCPAESQPARFDPMTGKPIGAESPVSESVPETERPQAEEEKPQETAEPETEGDGGVEGAGKAGEGETDRSAEEK